MKFTISSNTLYSVIQNNLKVIPTKATMPILDYFLFLLEDNVLTIVSSDLETTLTSKVKVNSQESEGSVAVPSKRLIDSLRELSDQPITFDLLDNYTIKISWPTGKLEIPGLNSSGYPEPLKSIENTHAIQLSTEWLFAAIDKTIFAAAENELRPIMSGIFFDITLENTTFVATDAHKLVRLIKNTPNSDITEPCSFILPKKPANLLRNILAKQTGDVNITFNNKNIIFEMDDHIINCRSIEGRYPNYNSVIPQNNNNIVLIDRLMFLNSIKRVSVCSNTVSNLIKLTIFDNQLGLIAQDTDFSVSADDSLVCDYTGPKLSIGFKATFIIEMLQNMSSDNVSLEFADATRAGLIIPYEPNDDYEQNLLMLLMPIMS